MFPESMGNILKHLTKVKYPDTPEQTSHRMEASDFIQAVTFPKIISL